MCAHMIGSDPDDLDRLAHTFDQQAQTLESTAGRVRAQVQASPWRGAAADRFRADWDRSHMPQLRQVSLSLRTAAKRLRVEAADQRRASGARVGSGAGAMHAGRSMPRNEPGAWVDVFMSTVGVFGLSAGMVARLGQWNMFQNYSADYHAFVKMLSEKPGFRSFMTSGRIPDFLRFNRSPVLQHLASRGITDTLKPAAGALGKASKGAGMLGGGYAAAVDAHKMFEAAASARNPGDWIRAGTHGVDAVGDVALATKGGMLVGVAAKAVALPIREATKGDWSEEGRRMVYEEVARNPGVVTEELGKATVAVGQTVASWFLPIPAGLK